MLKGTGWLATIGSTAPFVGLFGTVWGIMNAFIGISKAQTTNLAVVAPGIAEALLATAIGLVAAIPAVIIYNLSRAGRSRATGRGRRRRGRRGGWSRATSIAGATPCRARRSRPMAGEVTGQRLGGDDLAENSEINVTPFIDVILVLLIIFMVAAPLSTVDAPVDLPVSTAKPQPRPDKPVFLTLKSDLSFVLGEQPVAAEALASALDEATQARRRAHLPARRPVRALWRADAAMNVLRAAGYLKIALVGLEQ